MLFFLSKSHSIRKLALGGIRDKLSSQGETSFRRRWRKVSAVGPGACTPLPKPVVGNGRKCAMMGQFQCLNGQLEVATISEILWPFCFPSLNGVCSKLLSFPSIYFYMYLRWCDLVGGRRVSVMIICTACKGFTCTLTYNPIFLNKIRTPGRKDWRKQNRDTGWTFLPHGLH